jgi:hypothetical protein
VNFLADRFAEFQCHDQGRQRTRSGEPYSLD